MTPQAMTYEENDRLPQDRALTICGDGEGRPIMKYDGDCAQLFRESPPLEISGQPDSFADYSKWYDR